MPTRYIKRHDTAVVPRMQALDSDGLPIDLTGATVTYSLLNITQQTMKVAAAAAVVASQVTHKGEAYYTFQAADVNTAGTYREEWQIIHAGGAKETFPVGEAWHVSIEPDLGNA